ncbi:4'-phosphopantetheinyl transferase family protein [Enterobacillus tribolii]|uniref:Enterobactin synthase component D n=1 Tax=Enterobacillus tribolii TaxID=1487935 RepID=A0A370R4T0_9GAMM|nr:4'-phosphopantetheinyl transferase superfamily protein [Enterobacillus tribolii]MBW7983372.1 4'-phosphopantetheinyl transferase superfamily protein [Enterobacillus tribolii]RDK97432.1 4'-phosphopantetheinyl transferase EntD [Enterobacillus tribolii]
MLTLTATDSAYPFIPQSEAGFITQLPSLRYCQVLFDIRHYQDALFERFAIPFPPTLHTAVIKRRAEYLAARYAAQTLLRAGGCHTAPGHAPDRSPLWPSGWCGSLSHTDGRAIALVAPLASGLTPGIDIEMFAPETMRETAGIFTHADEQALLAASDMDYETALLIAFSAKESLFKALYPEVGHFFGFDAARVCKITRFPPRITLELTQTLTPDRPKGSRIPACYAVFDNRIMTLIA